MQIKSPDCQEEFEQIHALNYKTFVEEIPQHEKNEDKKRVDLFHDKNKYLIAKSNENVTGMVCYNTERPFSLDKKGVNIDDFIINGTKAAEIRLLAVEKEWRNKKVFTKLLKELIEILSRQGIFLGFISATTRQFDLYQKIGFKAFGNLVGKEGAYYQPMYVTFDRLKEELKYD